MPDAVRVFDEHRGLRVSVAYRILGSVTDAEDAVQETYLRWSKVDPSQVSNSRAFLVRVTTRLAIDRLRRAKARRESYVGPWLPEPILTGRDVAAGEDRMARFLKSVGSEPIVANLRVSMAPVNGGSGILVVSEGKPISVLVLGVSDGVVRTIYLVAKPQKLDGVRGIMTP